MTLRIHVEVEAQRKRDFPERMYRYYSVLWHRTGLPIYPIVLYLKGGRGLTREVHRVSLLGLDVLTFTYECVGLSALDSAEYGTRKDPLSAALAALMARGKGTEALEIRAVMLDRIARSLLDDARKYLLVNLVESYFALSTEEGKRLTGCWGARNFGRSGRCNSPGVTS